MADTVVYIDGLNFYYGAVAKRPDWKWVDFEALARILVPLDDILLIRYFTAIIRPRFAGDRSPERQNAYIRAVRSNPLIQVELGHFRSDDKFRPLAQRHPLHHLFVPTLRPRWLMSAVWKDNHRRRAEGVTLARVTINEEKGSDVNLGAWLLHDALAGATPRAQKAIVVTNDSDLATPLRLTRSHGVEIGLVNPHQQPTNRRLKAEATFEIPFRPGVLAKCQLPDTVRDGRNREIHRPREWR